MTQPMPSRTTWSMCACAFTRNHSGPKLDNKEGLPAFRLSTDKDADFAIVGVFLRPDTTP